MDVHRESLEEFLYELRLDATVRIVTDQEASRNMHEIHVKDAGDDSEGR